MAVTQTILPPNSDFRTTSESATQWWRDPWAIASVIVAAILTAIVIWPLFDAGRAALELVWRPSGDWAVLTMRVEDVGRHTPLVGPYSRFGWNHPGPLMYWLLAFPYHLFGDKPEALLAAAATLNALTVAALSAVAWRRGRLPLVALTMTATAILIHAMGPAMIRDPWNPFITLLPLALTVFLVWSVIEGDFWMWPPLAFLVSFELQSHIGYLPMLAMLGVSVFAIAWRRKSFNTLLPTPTKQRWWVLGLSSAVVIGCWLPVLLDQVAGTGNLGAIAHYFLTNGDSPAGFGTAFHVAADQLRFPSAPWLGRSELAGLDGALLGSGLAALVVPILSMAGSLWLAVRMRVLAALRLQLVVIATALGGLIATARVTGPLFDWVVRWWWVIACLWWLSIIWVLWSVLYERITTQSMQRIATGLLAVIATVVTLAATGPITSATSSTPPPSPSTGIVLDGFLQQTLDALQGSGPLLVVTTGSVRGDYGDALRLQLERAGIQVVAESNMISHLGPQRSESNRTPVGTLWIVSADQITQFKADPSMKFLGGWDPLTQDERNQFFIDQSLLQDQLIAAGRVDLAEALTNGSGGVDTEAKTLDGVDPTLVDRVEALRRKGDPVAVFLGPARTS
ncbi:unannotated protein [freshwater metagenome]|uniref:Unannotated protein n=2 Tax=freshwater metagenome TaxID=449393 RepID=A0A6J6NKG2_9ZZZZ|nr:hypothetical protein [Actinomycetota bacterium]